MDVSGSLENDDPAPARPSRRAILSLAAGLALGVSVPANLAIAAIAKPRAKPPGKRPNSSRRRRPKPRYKVVTRTFRSPGPIVINDEGLAIPYPSTLTVAGLRRGRLLDLNVTLSGFSHEYPRDVDMLLVAPNGTSAVIMSDVGHNSEVSNLTIVLDDRATVRPEPSTTIVSGIYRPWNEQPAVDAVEVFPGWPGGSSPNVALATFNGINPNGIWKLYVVDDASSDQGYISSWALTIKARVRV